MIDPNSEHLISLADAAGLLPARREGKKPHVSCLYRWTVSGCKGVILESVQAGRTRCTSREALARFVRAMTDASPIAAHATARSPLKRRGAAATAIRERPLDELTATSSARDAPGMAGTSSRTEAPAPDVPHENVDATKPRLDRWIGWFKDHRVWAVVLLVVVVIAGLATLTDSLAKLSTFAARLWPTRPAVTFLVIGGPGVLPQKVNQKEDEQAVFRFTLRNSGKNAVTVIRGEVTLGQVSFRDAAIPTPLRITLIDRRGHQQVILQGLRRGASYPIHLNLVISPGDGKQLYIWLRMSPGVAYPRLRGHP